MNKILFGGAFDPVHLGHINMAEQASIQLNADVIFLPSKFSVWKNDSTDVTHKINMLKIAIKGHERFFIDLYEINSGKEQNYSIDTVKYFINKYPNDNFYYLIGTDHVNVFDKWKGADELAKLVKVIYFNRPNYELDEKMIKRFNMTQINGSPIDISSTDIRDLTNLELNKEVIDYIIENNLYFTPKLHSYLKDKRFNHSVSVASLAFDIAKSNNIEHPEKAYIAGLLHDIGKEIDQKPIMEEHYKDYLDLPKFAYHQFAGEYIAKVEFQIVDKDILEAIKYHATGNEKMSQLAKIVYAADKIEPTRGFDSKELIDEMMKDIDEGFVKVLKANKEFLENNRGNINNPLTLKCFNYYLK